MSADLRLIFDAGTLVVGGPDPALLATLPGCRLDPRSQVWRAEARHYRAIVERLRLDRIPYADEARAYEPAAWQIKDRRAPFPHQREALDVWWKQQGRGVVVLPTGTGKTYLAILAIEKAGRPALVITPTIDLLNQWYDELVSAFDVPVGLMGGGYHERQALTVTTYDSAAIHVERWGNRFGLVIFDEAHHLPGPTYQTSAVGSIAPFRLGLTATLERADGQETLMPDLIGPVVYRKEITELAGRYLAEYETIRLHVELSREDQQRYLEARNRYRGFVEARGISMGSPQGWRRFLQETYRSPEGRAAFQAYREQKRIAQAAPAKIEKLAELLDRHRADRIIVFTADNATVYKIARQFLVPAITHQTRAKERRDILLKFHDGVYPILVTSQVLNEGVNVPAASVGIVLSGTGSVREHVQRLGRLLRKFGDKQAILYEVVTRDTAEEITSDRRRQHSAYD
jgi:superfamily II DNA or RNA helicase